jgi:hypothetical protein
MIKIVDIDKPLLRDLTKATLAVLEQRGIDSGGDLYKNTKWMESQDDKVMTLISLDYFYAQDTGRKRGIMPPVEPLIDWMKKNNIQPSVGQSYNELAFAIANSIKEYGFKGKYFTGEIMEVSTDILSEELAKSMAKNICDAIVIAIENKKL